MQSMSPDTDPAPGLVETMRAPCYAIFPRVVVKAFSGNVLPEGRERGGHLSRKERFQSNLYRPAGLGVRRGGGKPFAVMPIAVENSVS